MESLTPVVPEEKSQNINIDLYGYGDRLVTVKEVEDKLQDQRKSIDYLNQQIRDIREKVRSGLHKFDSKTDTVELDLEDVNEILEDIGANKILFTYCATVTYTVTITGIEADSEQEAESKALNAVNCSVDEYKCGEDASVDNEEYEASDIEREDD